jgi:hypothetical protein
LAVIRPFLVIVFGERDTSRSFGGSSSRPSVVLPSPLVMLSSVVDPELPCPGSVSLVTAVRVMLADTLESPSVAVSVPVSCWDGPPRAMRALSVKQPVAPERPRKSASAWQAREGIAVRRVIRIDLSG